MDPTIFRATRAMHLKIVLVSLVAVIVVVTVGLNARTGSFDTAGTASGPVVLKAGQAQTYAVKERAPVR